MLLHSLSFFIFVIFLFSIYWSAPKKHQNTILWFGSVFFYGSVNPFLLIVLFSITAFNFQAGKFLGALEKNRKSFIFLVIFQTMNFLILILLKNNLQITQALHWPTFFWLHASIYQITFPLGISFYLFQNMGYLFDIRSKKLLPLQSFFKYSLFIIFFPQLVLGPIEKIKHLYPQFEKQRVWKNSLFKDALFLVLFGLYKKIGIATPLFLIIKQSLNTPLHAPNSMILLYMIVFYIYCDFSGYLDIARGISKLFGINLFVNFNLPFFSKNFSDFFSRWNISFYWWIRDYMFYPIFKKRKHIIKKIFLLILMMLIINFWHETRLQLDWIFMLGLIGIILFYDIFRFKKWNLNSIKNHQFHWLNISQQIIFFHILSYILLALMFHNIPERHLMFQQFNYLKLFQPWIINIKTIQLLIDFSIYIIPLILLETYQFYRLKEESFFNKTSLITILIFSIFIVYIMLGYQQEISPYHYFKF